MIHSVEAFPISYPEPNDYGRRQRAVCLVRTKDDGREGWGEATTYFPEAALATATLIDALAPQLTGADPRAIETIMAGLYAHTWWYGTGGAGLAGFALSAIDVALWDLKGLLLGERVLDLLGGPSKERLPAIASSRRHGL